MTQENLRPRGLFQKAIRKTFISAAEHEVGKSAAALTYYLLFALFPLLLFISNLLGMLQINITSVSTTLLPFIPKDVVELLETYLIYVTENSSPIMFFLSLLFTIWFPMRAVKALMNSVRLAYHLEKPRRSLKYTLRQLAFTIAFIVIILLLFFLAILGRKVVTTAAAWLGIGNLMQMSPVILDIWQYLRFVLLAVIMFVVLGLLYAGSQDQKIPAKTIAPGAAIALIAWLVVSIGFSAYVENFADYSLIYGALGAVIVLMIWLFMTALTLIIGAEFNASLSFVREDLSNP